MMPMPINGYPCVSCEVEGCAAGRKVASEFARVTEHSAAELPEHKWYWLNSLIEAAFQALGDLYRSSGTVSPDPSTALPAVFDLCVNALYAQTVTDSGWVYCLGPGGSESPSQYYSFIGCCPRCAADGHYFPATPHKPESSNIGDASSATLALMLGKVLQRNSSYHHMVSSTHRSGDVDIIVYGEDIIAIGEIKASPLITYPLEVRLDRALTQETGEGFVEARPNHERNSPRIVSEAKEIGLLVPHTGLRVGLGPVDEEGWPFPALIRYIRAPSNLRVLIEAWQMAYQAYARRERSHVYYLNHGCGRAGGVPISDSKNAPGLDRTDDIKKGTYQILKFGAYYAERCERCLIRVFLAGNLHAVVHEEDYVSGLEDVVWTKEGLRHSEIGDIVAWRRADIFNLFDGIICFSKIVAKDHRLAEFFDLQSFSSELVAESSRR